MWARLGATPLTLLPVRRELRPVAAGESAYTSEDRIMKNTQQAGFTLIELVLVLAGLVLGTMFLPAVQSNSNPRVQCETSTAGCEMTVGRKAGE